MSGVERRRVVVVTGASAGVGRATVRAFARQGARIALLSRGAAGLEGARREVEALGGEALVIPTDVADAEQVEAAAELTERELGPIDVWVNNAMNSVFSPVREMTPEDYRRVTEVTYLGYVWGALSALRRMLPRDRGKIVFVGSALAYRGIPMQSAYCASKHAVQGFFDSLRTELMHDGSNVQITMVQMPALNTPQFRWVKSRLPNKAQPVPPILQPEVAADAILFAADHDRRELWVGWPTVKAIAGNRVVPWYADIKLAKDGVESQQIDEPEDPDRPHNLWDPVDDEMDFGAHGVFDSRSQPSTSQLWLAKHRPALTAAGALLAVAAATVAGLASRNGRNGAGEEKAFEAELARLEDRHPALTPAARGARGEGCPPGGAIGKGSVIRRGRGGAAEEVAPLVVCAATTLADKGLGVASRAAIAAGPGLARGGGKNVHCAPPASWRRPSLSRTGPMLNRRSLLALPLLGLTLWACDDSTAPQTEELSASEAAALAVALDNSSSSAVDPATETEGPQMALLPSEGPSQTVTTRTDDFEIDVPCPRGGTASLRGEHVLVIDSEEKFVTVDVSASQSHAACAFRTGEGIDITVDGTLDFAAARELREGQASASQSHTGSLDYITSEGKEGTCAIDLTTDFSLVPGEMTRSIVGSVCGHAVDVTTNWTAETG